MPHPPTLKPQEIPLDHPDSCNRFQPSQMKPLVATPRAIALYTEATIIDCLRVLHQKAAKSDGIDYLQVSQDSDKEEDLWFIEDGPGGAITALLPSDH